MNYLAVFLMGMPGSGKGTQAHLLAKHCGFLHFETNKIIRAKFASSPNNPEVKLAKKQYYGGKWIEPRVVVGWNKEALKNIDHRNTSIVFDGALRTLFEAKQLVPFLKELYGEGNVKAFLLNLPEDEALKRTSQRLICDTCGWVISPEIIVKVRVGDRCPQKRCPGRVVKRELDNPSIFERRVREYKKRTKPVLSYLQREVEFHQIDAKPSPSEIHQEIKRYLL